MPLWARLPFALQGVWPELTSEILTAANALLPRPGGVGVRAREGRESGSAWSPSLLTALTERAARRFNQLAPDEPLPAFAAAGELRKRAAANCRTHRVAAPGAGAAPESGAERILLEVQA